jgi:glycosyltransferase involved in cell wall biosynthesis
LTTMSSPRHDKLDVSVVIPTRNAENLIDACLESVRRNRPGEIIVVDGLSDDGTVSRARNYADAILSDDGLGVAHAREIGAEAAQHPYVAFVDVDVELPDEALAGLLEELVQRVADGIQAQHTSIDAGDYWSRALAAHHNRGQSRRWFGLTCTVFRRDVFLRYGLDPAFRTGEDIEFRYRLQKAKAKVFVSQNVSAQHRFEAGFRFALNQWMADGAGLGRMVRKYGWRASGMLAMPALGALLGMGRSLGRDTIFIPYYPLYMAFNYVGICRGVFDQGVSSRKRSEGP